VAFSVHEMLAGFEPGLDFSLDSDGQHALSSFSGGEAAPRFRRAHQSGTFQVSKSNAPSALHHNEAPDRILEHADVPSSACGHQLSPDLGVRRTHLRALRLVCSGKEMVEQ